MLMLRELFLNRQHSGAPPIYTINITNYTAIKNALVQITGILLMDCHVSWHFHFWLVADVWFITLSWICKWVTQTTTTTYFFCQCFTNLYNEYQNPSPFSPISLDADGSEAPAKWNHFAGSYAKVQKTNFHQLFCRRLQTK